MSLDSLVQSLRRAAASRLGDRPLGDLLLPENRPLLLMEAKSRRKGGNGLHEFARAVMALQELQRRDDQFEPQVATVGEVAPTPMSLAIVPVRMQPAAVVAQARGHVLAAGAARTAPPAAWRRWTSKALGFLRLRWGWFLLLFTVLLPRVLVAVVMRTFQALISQFFIELGDYGSSAMSSATFAAAQRLSEVEAAIVENTQVALPKLAGAVMVIMMAVNVRPHFPALPAL